MLSLTAAMLYADVQCWLTNLHTSNFESIGKENERPLKFRINNLDENIKHSPPLKVSKTKLNLTSDNHISNIHEFSSDSC